MPSAADFRNQYGFALDALRMLAQRDLLAWWDDTAELSFAEQRRIIEQPFVAITQTYGEQASYAAADYLFQQRSLDETLAGLEYPEVAAPVEFEQAKASYGYAMWLKEYTEDPAVRALALKKLMGIVQRLVVQPARQTVEQAIIDAGTGYARIPEPGACDFCLMLASRGAVYSRETVTAGMDKWHDGCRCVGIEVSDGNPLPKVNADLERAWQAATENAPPTLETWQKYLAERRGKLKIS